MARTWITLADYLGPYEAEAQANGAVRIAALDLLIAVNDLLDLAAADGVVPLLNAKTRSHVSGSGNGGWRPAYVQVGAAQSKHRTGHAVDVYDPRRELAAWCVAHAQPACDALANPDRLAECGLAMEDPRWTPSWVHLQDLLPGSGKYVYIPSNDPPLAAALAGQEVA